MSKESILVCEECGSEKVQTLAWVECNTNNYISEGPSEGADEQDNWCPDCDKHCSFTSKAEYEKRNNDEEE